MNSLAEIRPGNSEPLYNIGVVSRMTLITMATLRAWERRYDFPEASRTVGGHRLYSERDILRLRWVKYRIDEGMQTAQAINALRHQEQTGQPILTEEVLAGGYPLGIDGQVIREKFGREAGRPFYSSIRERILNALVNRNTQSADEILGEALAVLPPETLILEVIRPVMAEIGSLWEQGKIGIAPEHFATNYLRHRMLMWMVTGPPARSQQPVILACAPDEWHEGSLLIMGALLRRRLWPIIYLGQAVPLPDLGDFVRDTNPSFIVLIAMTEKSAASLVELPQWIPDAFSKNRPVIGFGGLVFVEQPEWRSKVPGIYLGSTFEEGILTIEKLLR